MALYVISDLHIGAGELDDCDAGCEDALVSFVDSLAKDGSTAELVLNGDSFDFVQAAPWRGTGLESTTTDGVPLAFTLDQSRAKATAIIDAHGRVFDALGEFVRRPGARLTVMPGNHDADLYWPELRALIEQRIVGATGAGEVHWHLDPSYVPAAAPHVWIEHGHQHDPLNAFFHPGTTPPSALWSSLRPPILPDRQGVPRLLECVGTRFLIRYLNGLDSRYPFVDNIKPFSRFLSIVGSSACTWRGGTARAALAALALARYAGTEAWAAPSNLLSLAHATEGTAAELAALEHASAGAFSQALAEAGCDFEGRSFDLLLEDAEAALRVLDFALAHPEVLDTVTLDSQSMLGIEGGDNDGDGDGMLSLLGGYKVDETALLRNAASEVRHDPRYRCVIMGHTHDAIDEPGYKNTGSWTRWWPIDPARGTPTWTEMIAMAGRLPLRPRYALVSDDPAAAVQLLSWPPLPPP